MAGKRIVIPNYMPALDLNGNPQAGAKLTFYANETTDLAPIYTSAALTVQHPNPITADASGVFPSIFADEDTEFSVAITDADDNPIGGLRNRDKIRPSLAYLDGVAAPVSDVMSDVLAEDSLPAARATMGTDLAANVSFIPSGTGAVTRSLQARLRDTVCVFDFDVVGDGVYDDAPGIRAAMIVAAGRDLYFPKPPVRFRCASALGALGNARFRGDGRRYVQIRKDYSGGPFLTVNDGAEIVGLQFDGQGATRTGQLVFVPNGQGNQIMRDVSLINGRDNCIYFEKDGGSRWTADNVQGSCFDVTKPTVEIEDVATGGNPRSFHRFETDGAKSFKMGGANNLYVSNSSVFDIDFSANNFDVTFANCRMAGTSGYLLKGSGAIMGGAVGPLLTIDTGATWNVSPGYSNSDMIDNSGGTSIINSAKIQSYTPVLNCGGVAMTLGTGGSYTGRYSRSGKLVNCKIRVQFGTGPTVPAGSITVTLPIPTSADLRQVGVQGTIQATNGTTYDVVGNIAAAGTEANLQVFSGAAIVSMTNAAPSALGDGTSLHLQFSYET